MTTRTFTISKLNHDGDVLTDNKTTQPVRALRKCDAAFRGMARELAMQGQAGDAERQDRSASVYLGNAVPGQGKGDNEPGFLVPLPGELSLVSQDSVTPHPPSPSHSLTPPPPPSPFPLPPACADMTSIATWVFLFSYHSHKPLRRSLGATLHNWTQKPLQRPCNLSLFFLFNASSFPRPVSCLLLVSPSPTFEHHFLAHRHLFFSM